MDDNQGQSGMGQFEAVVSFNKRIGERYHKLGLSFEGAGAEAFGGLQPGQFAQIDLSGAAVPAAEAIPQELTDKAGRGILLRRPFSFSDVSGKDKKIFAEILYRVVGPGSLRMTSFSSGQKISVIGPLGNGFWVPEEKKSAILISGGMGAGPLMHLAKVLNDKHNDIEVIVFAGAKTKDDLPFKKPLDKISQELGFSLKEFARFGIKSLIATDDGSAGFEGMVTDCFSEWLKKDEAAAKDIIIYACGPEAMLERTAEIAKGKDIDCQVSMERMMACGIGVCQSCAVECKVDGSNETVYKLCCKDGPVFDARGVSF